VVPVTNSFCIETPDLKQAAPEIDETPVTRMELPMMRLPRTFASVCAESAEPKTAVPKVEALLPQKKA
jgi:hypothetical protein